MKEKILSISIASYNVSAYLVNTVESLIMDDDHLNKIEIIIVNDGSKDDTSTIAHDLEKKYPGSVIVIDKKNGGYGSTINASLAIASGKYYRLLDGDDWYDTEALTAFIDYLETCESDVVITPYYEVRKEKILIDNHSEIPETTTDINRIPIAEKYFAMHEIAIKTKLLRSLDRQIVEHCFYTDAEYVFYCLCASDTISRFNKAVYCYRLGVEGQSVSIEGIRKHHEDLPKVADKIYDCYSAYSDSTGTKRELLDFCVLNITYQTYRAYMLLKKPLSKRKELMHFDGNIKSHYEKAYSISNNSKLIKTARKLHFRPYILFCKFVTKAIIAENQ